MDPSIKLSQDEGEPLDNPTLFKRMIGKLLYLTIARPDLSYSVNKLSQFLRSQEFPIFMQPITFFNPSKEQLVKVYFFLLHFHCFERVC